MARHPEDDRLLAWLDGSAPELDEHLDACDRCAAAIDHLAADEADLRPALLSLLAPPSDLATRVSEQLAARIQRRRDVELFGSMLGIPMETGRVVLDAGDGS